MQPSRGQSLVGLADQPKPKGCIVLICDDWFASRSYHFPSCASSGEIVGGWYCSTPWQVAREKMGVSPVHILHKASHKDPGHKSLHKPIFILRTIRTSAFNRGGNPSRKLILAGAGPGSRAHTLERYGW